ncbi:DNA cytosine methyltransferase [Mycoplasmopsis fermentans]|uniref:DNA cytosine methyltransferase n=1 Tax=Mycoplasmopsis fermentans TaxID=2115 RepID=UPI0001E32EB7|nr:DNA cytosine methyltransferase [Mycoplasmopsis fermentans]ADN69121.1 conserved hypothetical protein [Mycoplasmopsis fermentans JER]RMX35327.1 C-5 cytosine-specific DNA methylase family protein [Mycoplasmopsis fermentans MF-I2]RMX35468.1 C-5 cytosine-specific DNA methylase family protein [Mycoplasmopsis fermentans MF-I1]
MLGIRKDFKYNFTFPKPIPLTKKLNWVFDNAEVNKEIGYTLRVGGKGSWLNNRRNWDTYLVNNEAKRLQSFSDDFIFLVAKLVVTKQLGNSVQLMQ